MFEAFINEFNEELNNEIADHERRHDANAYEPKWTSTRHKREDIIRMLLTDELMPSLSWVSLQHNTNTPRSHMNENYYGRIKVVNKIQKHAITKMSIDVHYSNTFY